MTLRIKCAKCSETMVLDDDTIKVAEEEGIPLPNEHTVCPRDRATLPVYAVRTVVERYPTWDDYKEGKNAVLLASYGDGEEAPSLEYSLPQIEATASQQWAQVRGLASLAEDGIEEEGKE